MQLMNQLERRCRTLPSITAIVTRFMHVTEASRQFSTDSNPDDQERQANRHCLDLTREKDYENYLCGLRLPADIRPTFFALRAFNVELACIKEAVHGNIQTGTMRLQFWEDTCEEIYQDSPKAVGTNPVVRALISSVARRGLERGYLLRMVEARRRDLTEPQPATLKDLERYAEHTQSAQLHLLLGAAGVPAPGSSGSHRGSEAAYRTMSHLGKAMGLVTALRGAPFHRALQQTYLPRDLMRDHGASVTAFLRGARTPDEASALGGVIYDLAHVARAHLGHAAARREEALLLGGPEGAAAAAAVDALALPAVGARRYLGALEGCGYNVFDESLLELSNQKLDLQWRILKASLWGSPLGKEDMVKKII